MELVISGWLLKWLLIIFIIPLAIETLFLLVMSVITIICFLVPSETEVKEKALRAKQEKL